MASLQVQIASINPYFPKYDKIQQERSEILGLAAISNPIVTDEVYWPGVLTALTRDTPTGGTITSFSASSIPRVVPTAGAACGRTTNTGRDPDRVAQHLPPVANRVYLLPQLVLHHWRLRQADGKRI